jgi:D-alanyl-D-alanine dipeptidase
VAFDYRQRLDRARGLAGEAGLDALIVGPGPDLLYLAGYDPPPLERLTTLMVRSGRDPVLLVPELERPRVEASPVAEIVEIVTWRDGSSASEAAARVLAGGGRFAVSDRLWASHLIGLQAEVSDAAFMTASPILSPLRSRKEPAEIDLLRRAARSADDAFNRVARDPFAGRSEHDVAHTLGRLLEETGHDSVAFTIVASGPNAASPHHEPGDRAVRVGDAVVMDFGGRVRGYCSDITRTVSVGRPTDELQEVHEIVRRAQDAAFQAAGPGVPAEEVDGAARSVIEDAGYGDAFVHRTGHGIGLEEHEEPYIVAGNETALVPGNCFSIEPGIYLDGNFGVRIEDIVAVTEDGTVRLNHAPRELLMVE